jgi:hypothetical protein
MKEEGLDRLVRVMTRIPLLDEPCVKVVSLMTYNVLFLPVSKSPLFRVTTWFVAGVLSHLVSPSAFFLHLCPRASTVLIEEILCFDNAQSEGKLLQELLMNRR